MAINVLEGSRPDYTVIVENLLLVSFFLVVMHLLWNLIAVRNPSHSFLLNFVLSFIMSIILVVLVIVGMLVLYMLYDNIREIPGWFIRKYTKKKGDC